MENLFDSIMDQEAKRAETIQEIRERFPKVKFPTPVMEPIFFGRFGEKKPVLKRKLMMDKATGFQYDVVSDEYKLVHHEEMVKMVLDACPPEFGTPKFKISMMLDGARAMMQASFDNMGDYSVKGSKITPMIRMTNSINRSTHLEYAYGAEELICTNGLVAFREESKSKYKHLNGSLDKLSLTEQIKKDMIGFSEQNQIWNKWATMMLSDLEIMEVVDRLPFSDKEREKLIEIPLMNHENETLGNIMKKKGASLWTVNSAATQFAKHAVKAEHRTANLESEIGFIMNNFYK